MAEQRIYRVIFNNQGQVVELYARQVAQGGLLGFVEVEDLVFGARSKVVVDPGEESLKSTFEGVRRFYVPMHSVIRIDEVEREGVSRVVGKQAETADIRPFPMPSKPPMGNPPGGPERL